MVTARHKRRAAVLSGAVALALALAGCGGGGGGAKAPAAATAAPSPSKKADPDAAEKVAVLEAYQGMWEARNRTYATAKLDPQLETYAGNRALSNIKVTLLYHQEHGTVMTGTPVNAPEVDGFDDAKTKAVLRDCVDTTTYNEVEAKTGKAVPVGTGPRRHVYNASAIKTGGKWVIWTTDIDRAATC
ncbi:hypothetical protein [Streptomyces sp. cmx-4-9]|uniref:hypothetical protein n=1 Tax=Streptomyces sp. cmx-4-9 TaxID=2790941 RepID=UPI00397F7379